MVWTAIVGGGQTVWGWLTRNPVSLWIIGGCVAVFLAWWRWQVVKHELRQEGARAKEAEIQQRSIAVKEAVNKRQTELIVQERTNADEALAARDRSPHYPSADVVPDDLARHGFRDRRGGGTS